MLQSRSYDNEGVKGLDLTCPVRAFIGSYEIDRVNTRIRVGASKNQRGWHLVRFWQRRVAQ
jgi:hypothetical protein